MSARPHDGATLSAAPTPVVRDPGRVVVVGAEGSGTHMLTKLLRLMGVDAAQRSLPHGGVWWVDVDGTIAFDPETGIPFPSDARFVVVSREGHSTVESIMRRRLAPDRMTAERNVRESRTRLDGLPGERIRYESVTSDPLRVLRYLADVFGVPRPSVVPMEIYDGNAKWQSDGT